MWHYGQVTHLTKAQLPCLYSRKVHDNLRNFLAHSVAYSQSLVSIDIINSQWCNGSPIGFSNSKGPFQLCHLPSPLSAHLLVTWKLFSFPLLPHQSQSPLISSLECISFLYPMAWLKASAFLTCLISHTLPQTHSTSKNLLVMQAEWFFSLKWSSTVPHIHPAWNSTMVSHSLRVNSNCFIFKLS